MLNLFTPERDWQPCSWDTHEYYIGLFLVLHHNPAIAAEILLADTHLDIPLPLERLLNEEGWDV